MIGPKTNLYMKGMDTAKITADQIMTPGCHWKRTKSSLAIIAKLMDRGTHRFT